MKKHHSKESIAEDGNNGNNGHAYSQGEVGFNVRVADIYYRNNRGTVVEHLDSISHSALKKKQQQKQVKL